MSAVLPRQIELIRAGRAEQPAAFIMGVTTAGLAFVRSLGRKRIPVYSLDSAPLHPGMFSRYGKRIVLPDILAHEDVWLEFLLGAGKKVAHKPVLIPAGDEHVMFVSKYRSRLEPHFHFRIPDSATVAIACNKRLLYERMRTRGVPMPFTFFLDRDLNLARLESEKISFPCVLKPYYTHLWKKRGGKTKLEIARDMNQLVELYESVSRPSEPILGQEVIPGGDDALFGYMSYLSCDSNPLARFTKQKLRQNPPLYGNGSLQIARANQEIVDLSVGILEDLHYCGLVSIEYKWDHRDGTYKLLDLNPRAVSGQQLAVDSGVDIPYLNYLDLLGKSPDPKSDFKEGTKYVHISWDVQAFLGYRKMGGIKILNWLKSLVGIQSFALLSIADPKPFLVQLALIVAAFMRGTGATSTYPCPSKKHVEHS